MLPAAEPGIMDLLLAGRLGRDSLIIIAGALTSFNASLGASGYDRLGLDCRRGIRNAPFSRGNVMFKAILVHLDDSQRSTSRPASLLRVT